LPGVSRRGYDAIQIMNCLRLQQQQEELTDLLAAMKLKPRFQSIVPVGAVDLRATASVLQGYAGMHFDFVDLKLFVNLANTRNLTRAAERTNLSLSAASARIKHLEDSVGVKLIYRHSQGVTLTPQGDTFLHHAGLILQQSDSLHGDMEEYSLGIKGHVRLYASQNASTGFLPDVLSRFLYKNPRVTIDLQEQISRDVVSAVQSGVTDIGIVSSGIHTGDLEILPYFCDHVVVVASLQHPLATRQHIAFEECLDYEFVGIPGARWVNTFLSSTELGSEKRMRIRVQAGSYESVCHMVAANVGISVMPESAARRNASSMALKIIKISNEWALSSQQICVRSLEQLPRFSRELVDMMANDFRATTLPNMKLA
jgi:DNA-binding transcriptional LysR family regulator